MDNPAAKISTMKQAMDAMDPPAQERFAAFAEGFLAALQIVKSTGKENQNAQNPR